MRFTGFLLFVSLAFGETAFWPLQPVLRPEVPAKGGNPIDAFLGRSHRDKGLRPAVSADKATLLRRVTLDLTGLPPTPAELDAFLADSSADAYARAVDRLLNDPQHGVRYGRHWLDVLAYADVDSGMLGERGIHLWRDWVIHAINEDRPYDQFVRALIAGDLSGRPDDFFATGFLTRSARAQGAGGGEQMATAAVETISAAFMAMTTACAKCHDHMYDPIAQRDYYAMKSLFDPLVPDKRVLATASEVMAMPGHLAKWEADQKAIQARMDEITQPYYQRLFEDRLTHLPPDVAAIYRKPESGRTEAEKKIAKDYEPVVSLDPRKYRDVMTAEETARYEGIRKGLTELRRDPPTLPAFWTVRPGAERAAFKSHIYVAGDASKKGEDVTPGFPFAPKDLAYKGDRRETFLTWLTAPTNPLFARVAVNRMWQWHFGEGIVATPSDFGNAGEKPTDPALLDWLAAEFAARRFSMKAMHRLIVTSEAYQRAAALPEAQAKANLAIDPKNRTLWRFPLRRLDAEAIRDSVLFAAGTLDLSVGGKSFRAEDIQERRVMSETHRGDYDKRMNRRAIYMGRGNDLSMNMMPAYLSTFDAESGHLTCARRQRTITAPQVLFLMNNELTNEASKKLAERMRAAGDLRAAVNEGYRITLGRPPSNAERDHALSYTGSDPARLQGFAWMLLNLSEFVFLP